MTTLSDLAHVPGTLLVCADHGADHGEWSSTPGDYFWMATDEPFTCECGADLIEVRRSTTYEPIGAQR